MFLFFNKVVLHFGTSLASKANISSHIFPCYVSDLSHKLSKATMAGVSNKIIASINFLTFLLSLWILRQGLWLINKGTTDCERFLQWPVIGLGGFVMLLSIAGFVGACFRVTWALSLYMVFLSSLIILMLIGFTVFAFSVTYKGDGRSVEGRVYKEYRLGDYSKWLQDQVENKYNWNKIKSCIQDAKICQSLAEDQVNAVAEQFYKTHLSPIQVWPFFLDSCHFFNTDSPDLIHFDFSSR